MSQSDESPVARAVRAQNRLIEMIADNPEVTLIDIGRDLTEPAPSQKIVLRVHVKRPTTLSELGLPDEIDGHSIALVTADYHEM